MFWLNETKTVSISLPNCPPGVMQISGTLWVRSRYAHHHLWCDQACSRDPQPQPADVTSNWKVDMWLLTVPLEDSWVAPGALLLVAHCLHQRWRRHNPVVHCRRPEFRADVFEMKVNVWIDLWMSKLLFSFPNEYQWDEMKVWRTRGYRPASYPAREVQFPQLDYCLEYTHLI